ncbi:LOW QUALITY PROTEIN: hypothetical protein BRADI_4g39177v3 [Brachypodium distachyon]|uniref:Ubiquitin-like domain-containing protein n=1 Tax=Brachypodium distachyon TaxID=15368 RepID=A0A2K2CT96_BRADI|nr:LOW QUALITY PROTEIN: hypothetical protein BRADI_4g39177v3 [Brachypodium distachyon]
MDVTFETTQGRRFEIEIWFLSTVRRMKEYVREEAGIPVESQRLFFNNSELEDDLDTQHYAIAHGSHVLIVLPDSAAPSPGAAAIDKQQINQAAAEMDQDDPPEGEGTEVRDRAVIRQPPAANPVAAAAKVVLCGGNKQQGQQIGRMSVEVKWGGRSATVEVGEADAVKELRAELDGQLLQLPEDGGYFFIYKQNVMEEDRTLRWHDVRSGDTIEIFNGRVTGGA